MFGINPLINQAYEAGLQPALGWRHLPRAATAWAALPRASMDKPVGLQKPNKLAKSDDLQSDIFRNLLQRVIDAVINHIHPKQACAQAQLARRTPLEQTHYPSPTDSPIPAKSNALERAHNPSPQPEPTTRAHNPSPTGSPILAQANALGRMPKQPSSLKGCLIDPT